MWIRTFALAWLLAACSTGIAESDTYLIRPDGSGDFPTIQAAIDVAVDGDAIELTPGTFRGEGNRDIDCLGKALSISSRDDDPASCVLDCEGTEELPHRAFLFQSGEPMGTLLSGVTITNAWIDPLPEGGAVLCRGGSAPTIRNCVFEGNEHSALFVIEGCSVEIDGCVFLNNHGRHGGAIYCQTGRIGIADCEFIENSAELDGGAYHGHASSGVFTNCSFTGNSAGVAGAIYLLYGAEASLATCWFETNSAESGGGVFSLHGFGHAVIEACTFVENSARGGAVMETSKMSYARFLGCTLWGNRASNGPILFCGEQETVIENSIIAFSPEGQSIDGEHPVTLRCVDIFGNAGGDWVDSIADQYGVEGNIAEDPLFCDAERMDFMLRSDSPCATENNEECDQIGAWPVGCEVPVPVDHRSWGRMKGDWR